MRPLRLLLDGFGSYRERTDIDFSDVDLFVLTGATGSGKSTVIDALCFALYGTVPRWGKGNVIKNALAPSTTECRVCLVFEAGGARYAAARQLRRDAKGAVHTKEARLDRLDPAVPPDADLATLLAASVEQTAEGPDDVTAGVTRLLGIGYEHFTQCVLLPQGRFAEFLHAKPADRQDLLVKLLAYSVYDEVGVLARERGKEAGARTDAAQRQLAELGDVTDADVEAAAARVDTLAGLVARVDTAVEEMADLRTRWNDANAQASAARARLAELAGVAVPNGVQELSTRLADADADVARTAAERQRLDDAEAAAERACAELPARDVATRWRDAHQRAAVLRADLESRAAAATRADAAERDLAAAQTAADTAAAEAEAALTAAERADLAATLATGLAAGDECPVCLRVLDHAPHGPGEDDGDTLFSVTADPLGDARAAVDTARRRADAARVAHTAAAKAAGTAHAAVDATREQLDHVAAALADAPPMPEVDAVLARRVAADTAVEDARAAARRGRAAADAAARSRAALQTEERDAWSALRAARDRVVALDAPAVDGDDLAVAWRALVDWAAARRTTLAAEADALAATEAALRAAGTAAATALVALLAEHGIELSAAAGGPDVKASPVVLARHRERADRDLTELRARRERSIALAADVARHREDQQVADLLGGLLRSTGFERWLLTEALDSLVTEASATLMQLSGGQYELHRGARNELTVVDHADAGTERPVHTLSGGETFQASLALALALSRQVAGLSGGRRDLNSMFLDEGFGTLDDATLDVVASTLEQLAEQTDRMIGIVTHVPALASRVPVQFAVTRDGASSRLERLPV